MIGKQKWVEVIKDFNEKELPVLIERDIGIPIEMPINRVISIIGPRRAGKTYAMFQTMKMLMGKVKKEQMLYVNFERADFTMLGHEDLVVMLETFYDVYPENKDRKVWLFLDEIQNVSNWEKFVRTALDENIAVYITGSSSKLLSKEIATSMGGRSLTYTLLPFSFVEYLRAKGIEKEKSISSAKKAKIVNGLMDYMEYGGYPEAVIYPKERERILTDIKETAIYRDVIDRSKIRNTNAMRLLMNALVNSKEFSVNKFYNFLKSSNIKIGKNVLYNYLQHLNDAFFVFMLRKFSYSYKEAEQSIPKSYFIDNGLLKVSGIDDLGRLMENLVFLELKRRALDIAYFKEMGRDEVDFIVKDGKKIRELIQVCYNINDYGTKERETKPLLKASEELKCKKLLVITWDYEAEEKYNKNIIKFIPLWKWLLERL
jgi:uncharacterized protein